MPERLHRLVPHVKLIYLLRDPIDRMLSHYLHNRFFGRETRSFSEAVADRSYRNNYVRTSMYRFQLAAFLEHFPLERVLLVTIEELKDARGEALRRIFRFIGVDPHFEGSDFDRLFNQTQATGDAAPGGADRGASAGAPGMDPTPWSDRPSPRRTKIG